jgi:amino acid adenylation domain-containing protein
VTALDLIARLRDAGIRIRAVNGDLELDAPRDALTDELRTELVRHKPNLLRLLSWTRRSGQSTSIPLVPVDRHQPLALSWAQQRLWFLDQLEPGSSAYNISWTVRLKGELHFARMQAALNRLVERHESLRTCFPAEEGVPQQKILLQQDIAIAQQDLTGATDEKVRATLGKLAARSFNLAAGPLLRVTMLRLSASEHILLVLIHHIVADGASMRILFRELAALYDEETGGVPAELAALPVQYADYAAWQRQWLDGDELERQSGYWTDKLDGLPPLLELPWDRPRSAAMRYRGASVLRVLPDSLASELRSLGSGRGCTLFMVMLAAFYVLLMKYTGRNDLVVGTPMGGRPRTDLEGLIGFFINTVVLRQDLGGNPDFESLMQAVRETALEAHAHQELPFERLVEILEPQRELSYSPVFQVMFDLQEEPRWRLPVRDLEVVPEVVFSSRTSSFDLTLSIRQAEKGLDAMFEYDTDLFDEESIERLASHYQNLLEEIVAHPTAPVADLSLIAGAERRALIESWSQVNRNLPAVTGLGAMFESCVREHPDVIALRSENLDYSYAELNRRANRLAHRLQAQGVAPDQPVLLLAERKPETFAAMLAVLKAGGCVVPLDPEYPQERLSFMARDTAAHIALVPPGEYLWLPAEGIHTLELEPALFETSDYPDTNPTSLADASCLAFILYTSGTTGRPKGVELPHLGLLNYVRQLGQKTGVGPADRVLQFSSLSFDISIEECFTALLHGATLVLRSDAMVASMQDFANGCAQAGITWASLPTAWWHELCRSLEHDNLQLPPALRNVVIGGERAGVNAFRSWQQYTDGVRLFNTYGPTETSIAATWCELTHTDPDACGELPIGAPVPNVSAWVLDEQQQVLPAGVPGMLYVGGAGLARGYRNLPGLSAANFVEVAGLPGRLYRTGDRARYLPDGRLVFLGRFDTQIKIRGHRIEPGEIESRLTRLEGVEQAVVLVRNKDQLIAYVTGDADVAGLRAQLQPHLPDYMLPAAFVPLAELPLTRNGKLDLKALPEAEPGRAVEHMAPRTPTERKLAAIWSNILELEGVGIHDDFFALGGHSLIATRVVAHVRDALGVNLSLRVLFQDPTIAGLAAALDSGAAVASDERITRRKVTDDLPPLSWAQQRLWFIDQLESGSTAYNLHWAARLNGSLDINNLQRAIDALVERHEILRTSFGSSDGEPVQLVAAATTTPVIVTKLTCSDPDKAQARAALLKLTDQPFNLYSGSLFRVHVLQTCVNESYLLIVLHHIVADGWSMGVLFRELAELYAAFVNKRSPLLESLPIQYADYAVWQRNWLSGEELTRQEYYWRRTLNDAPPLLELPLDKPRPAVQGYRGAWASHTFSSELLAGVHALATREGCTVFMVLLAAFKVLLARYTGREDIVVGTPIAGRRYTELDNLVGFFLNTLALRTDLNGSPTFRQLLARIKRTTLDAYEHQDLPFEKLLEVLQPDRSTAYPPLVQIMFNLHNAPSARMQLEGLETEAFELNRSTAKFDLSVAVAERKSGLQIGFEYNTDLYEQATIEQLLGDYGRLLAAFVARPDSGIGAVEPVPGAGAPAPRQSYDRWDAGTAHASLADRFASVAQRFATRPAVQVGAENWTYAELEARANQVAQLVHAAGDGGRNPVGLLLGHDANMVAGLLGVIKAGCPYVPLDADAPPARIQSLVSEARIQVLVTDAGYRDCAADLADTSLQIIEVPATLNKDIAPPEIDIQPGDLAYILFTSGSTGVPKGVMQTHRNVLHHVRTYTEALHINAHDRLSLLANYGFDAALMDIYGALLNGACLCPVDLRGDTPLQGLPRKLFGEQGITILHSTPTVFRLLAEHIGAADNTRGVRLVVLGGEEALATDFELFRQHFVPPALFVNGLGPSESTLALQFFADHSTQLQGAVMPVGSPVSGTRVLLCNKDDSEAAFTGELVICSRFVATGYWNQPDETRAAFSSGQDELGLVRYRTGDIVRRLPDGQLAFSGRTDQQLKIRGQRIEPGEIEAQLLRHPAVDRCVVSGANAAFAGKQAERQADKQLVAWYSGDIAETELRFHLQRVLPAYMVPTVLTRIDEWPLTPNGKTNLRALPVPSWQRNPGNNGGAEFVAPRNATEKQLAGIWAGLLAVDRPGVHDDFFGLGGHSLLATRVIARAYDAFAKAISVREFFGAPTIAGLAAIIDAKAGKDTGVQLTTRRRVGKLPPLSWSQQRLWFLDQLEPDSAAYNLHWAARLRGKIDPGQLQEAVDRLVDRHESLRTAFGANDGEPVQLIAPELKVPVEYDALPAGSDDQVHSRLLKLIRQPFNLRTGPLLRVHLLQLAADESVLLLAMHHIISDGWSMGILFRELTICYNAGVSGCIAKLPELPVQYADYAAWQREWLAGTELERQEKYWREKLRDVPPVLELPFDHVRPPVQRYRGAWANRQFSPKLSERLRALAAERGCTLFMVLLAAFYVLIARYTGREDLVVGTPVAGRKRSELEDLVGFFLNTLVLRADLAGNPSFIKLLGRVQETTLEAYDHQELPFEKLLEILQPVRSTAHAPLVQVIFNLHNEPSSGLGLQGVDVEPFAVDRGTAKFDLSVAIVEGTRGLHAGFEYSTDLFEHDTVSELLRHYGELLEVIVLDPDQPVASFALSSNTFQSAPDWPYTPFPDSALKETVAARFGEIVRRFPDRPAVQTAGCTLTYRELNALANTVGQAVQQAAGSAATIALLLGHDASMVAGLIGVVKAGCSYVPIDPGAPPARIRSILEEAGIAVVVTDAAHRDLLHAAVNGSLAVVEVPLRPDVNAAEPAKWSMPDNLAYILFTSGSTGVPKGVLQSQRNLLHHARTYSNSLHISEQDRLTMFANYCFDAAVMDIFGALLNGACLHPLELKQEDYPGQLLDLMGLTDINSEAEQGFGATILHCTPTVFRYLMRHKVCRHDLTGIRAVVLGGEEALGRDFGLFRKHFAPPTIFVNGFGPSESTLATQFFADHNTRLAGDVVPIGRPVAGTDILLMDEAGQSGGISGEVVIRSRYVSTGYLNRDDLNSEKFAADAADPELRIYRTGDRARMLPTGDLAYTGRLDAQVKVRGHRVEPGEVEATLAQLDKIERSTVVLRSGPAINGSGGESRLVAYVVGDVSEADMRRHLKSALPEYMLPAAFVKLDGLPLKANGKVDRSALPEPEWERALDILYVAPRTPTEKQLAGIWSDVLGIQEVGVHDDFFELGGHSLLAAQLVSRVTDSLQVGLPLRKLFDAPTIADIAEHVETLQWALRGIRG